MDNQLYKEYILSVYANMHNKHELANATASREGYNPNCGDKITIHITTKEGLIEDMSFTGDGCLLSQVSAELLSDYAKGKQIDDITKMSLEQLLELVGIHPTPTRMKCIELSLMITKSMIKDE